jgi:hypothetical protein
MTIQKYTTKVLIKADHSNPIFSLELKTCIYTTIHSVHNHMLGEKNKIKY